MKQKIVVVSAVNLVVGGTLTILKDCLSYLSDLAVSENIRIIAIVHRKDLAIYPNIEYIEIPWAKKSWIARLWCEYVTMNTISKKLPNIFLWLSLHDTTPRVKAERRAVYCHNSFPFYNWNFFDLKFSYKIVLFALFSKYAYWINIKRNKFVIVQQDWFKDEFVKNFGLSKDNLVVAYPPSPTVSDYFSAGAETADSCYHFFYPSTASTHKNFHLVCEAASKIVCKQNFKVHITVNPVGTPYEKWLYKRYSQYRNIVFTGFLSKQGMIEMYRKANCLIFASKIESWGLPISEFLPTGKPMLLADIPYAKTTSQGSKLTSFFDPNHEDDLRNQMIKLIKGDNGFLHRVEVQEKDGVHVNNWEELFKYILLE